ncbi:MAG: hypothetical protein EPN86_03385 [Nanoarchaeota archaeon]|nr:MAG: hypothetical protein EPN86_03385 [Nanoarchaeota archaeon]
MAGELWTDKGESQLLERANFLKEITGGSEAIVRLYLMKDFPGIGGAIKTYQAIPVAVRMDRNYSPQVGHHMFLKHAVLKKLDDYFFRTGKYQYSHVSRPLGSLDGGYIYEWVMGSEGFPWEIKDNELRRTPVRLDEFIEFVGLFEAAGIPMGYDISDADDGRVSKNVIHQLNFGIDSVTDPRLNCTWKRIDFGPGSLGIKYGRLMQYLADNEGELKRALDGDSRRYNLMKLACGYLADPQSVSERDIGTLTEMAFNFRTSTLSHLNMRGLGF